MPDEITQEVTNTPEPSAPAFSADQIVLSQLNLSAPATASSLPSESTQTADTQAQETVQETETVATAETATTETPLEVSEGGGEAPAQEDEFSFSLPDGSLETASDQIDEEKEAPTSEKREVVRHEDSPLGEDAPQWQHEAFNRLKEDSEISEEDRKLIAKTHPSRWDSMREWNKSHKFLGKFRNGNYPMEQMLSDLSKQSAPRFTELKNGIIHTIVQDVDSLNSFADAQPETYSKLMVGLIRSQPDVITQILSQLGYSVSKESAFDVDAIRSELMSEDEWDIIAGTGVEEKVKTILSQYEKVKQLLDDKDPQVETKNKEDKEDVPVEQTPAYQMQQSTLKVMSSWKADLEAGVRAAGIVPPTEAEKRNHPSAARLKELAYTLAITGVEGRLPAWHEHLFEWGGKREGFNERSEEIHRLLKESSEAEALSYARSVSSDVYEFGKLRASIAYIKNLYRDADRLMNNSLPEASTPNGNNGNGVKPPQAAALAGGASAPSSGFVSDSLILQMIGKG